MSIKFQLLPFLKSVRCNFGFNVTRSVIETRLLIEPSIVAFVVRGPAFKRKIINLLKFCSDTFNIWGFFFPEWRWPPILRFNNLSRQARSSTHKLFFARKLHMSRQRSRLFCQSPLILSGTSGVKRGHAYLKINVMRFWL